MSIRVTIPTRLEPYLKDMLHGGLWGLTLRQTIVRCIERQVRQEVKRGAIPLRIKGRIVKRRTLLRRRR